MAENSVVVSSSIKFSSAVDEMQFNSKSTTTSSGGKRTGTLEANYDVERCVQCIRACGFAKNQLLPLDYLHFDVQIPHHAGEMFDEYMHGNELSPLVALQFPDSQLYDASKVAQLIEERTNSKVYILADTSYGSCCVDEIAADHVKADLIIHFGPSCLSPTERIPALFIFGKEPISINSCCQSFKDFILERDSRILIIYEVVYHHAIKEIYSRLASEYKHIVRASVNCLEPEDFCCQRNAATKVKNNGEVRAQDSHGCQDNGGCARVEGCKTVPVKDLQQLSITTESGGGQKHCRFGRTFALAEGFSIEDYMVFYIGKESLTLTNYMMTYNKCKFFSYDPERDVFRKETINVNRMLMRRYYLIEKAKDSQVVGILIGTLGVANYSSAISRIKNVLRHAGKKYYTFVVGKLNAEKLANFMEIDVFVLVACPENSLINSQDFYKPIVTPFEIEIACTSAREWTGDYITDFQQLLPGGAHYMEIVDTTDEEDHIPDVSLISGQLRPAYSSSRQVANCNIKNIAVCFLKKQRTMGIDRDKDMESNALVKRNQETALLTQHHTSAVEFLAKRSWKGLDPSKGEAAVSKAVEGTRGIAAKYTHEPKTDDGNT